MSRRTPRRALTCVASSATTSSAKRSKRAQLPTGLLPQAQNPNRPQVFSRVLKNTRSCHSEGGFCPRNLLFSWILAKSRFLAALDRKSTRLNSSHLVISYAVFCLKKKNH